MVAATRLRPLAGTVALLVIGIGSTGFDGAKEGPLFNGVRDDLQAAFMDLGFGLGTALELAFFAGLLAAIALVGAIWRLGTRGLSGFRFAHTLIPIAAAYVVAHYF